MDSDWTTHSEAREQDGKYKSVGYEYPMKGSTHPWSAFAMR